MQAHSWRVDGSRCAARVLTCVDQLLGTFRETLGASQVYTGEWSERNDDNADAPWIGGSWLNDDDDNAEAADPMPGPPPMPP